jgi:hypothetical protein
VTPKRRWVSPAQLAGMAFAIRHDYPAGAPPETLVAELHDRLLLHPDYQMPVTARALRAAARYASATAQRATLRLDRQKRWVEAATLLYLVLHWTHIHKPTLFPDTPRPGKRTRGLVFPPTER